MSPVIGVTYVSGLHRLYTCYVSRAMKLDELGLRLSEWFERWFPDAFVLACVAVGIVFAGSVVIGNSPTQSAVWFGAGFWDLVAFTMQMTMIIITGYTLATAPSVYWLICRIAAVPQDGKTAAAYVGLLSILSSMISWSFSLIFSGLLAREVANRVRGSDYRAIGAAAYLGVGSTFALGLSSSAALLMAAPASLPQSILRISGVIPLGQTLGLWQSLLIAAVLLFVSMAVCYYSAPGPKQARGMEDMGVTYQPAPTTVEKPTKPGEWPEYSPILTILISGLGFAYLASEVATKGASIILELNHYVFLFLVSSLILHWRPRSFGRAVAAAVPAVGGVLVQYPLYAGIVRIMTESGLADRFAHFFVAISNVHTFPILVGIYSAFLGLFIPSAGGKWLIEAPYILEAAKSLQVHLGWTVQTYNATEALANLIHPFWMLPLIGILGLKARDIVGYSMLQFVIHVPVVLFLVWILNYTLTYVPPVIP
jgi:short-chain fatty acids transporter